MKYFLSFIFSILLLVNCTSDTVNEPTSQDLSELDIISITMIGNEKVRLNESIVHLSELQKNLEAENMSSNTIVSVDFTEDSPTSDLRDIHEVFRKVGLLRINYTKMKS